MDTYYVNWEKYARPILKPKNVDKDENEDLVTLDYLDLEYSYAFQIAKDHEKCRILDITNTMVGLCTESIENFVKTMLNKISIDNFDIITCGEYVRQNVKNYADSCENDCFLDNIYMVSSKDGVFGATALGCPDVLDTVCHKLGTNQIYILPISVDELNCVDASNPEMLSICNGVLHMANKDNGENFLSDNVYKYVCGEGVQIA